VLSGRTALIGLQYRTQSR